MVLNFLSRLYKYCKVAGAKSVTTGITAESTRTFGAMPTGCDGSAYISILSYFVAQASGPAAASAS